MVRLLENDLYPVDLSQEEYIKLIDYSYNLRKHILKMITDAQTGHPGGSLSCVDLLTCLYKKILKHDKNSEINSTEVNDIFILSKGHAAATVYAILAEEKYIEIKELETFRKFGSRLQGHPKGKILPTIEVTTGSLGIGASIGIGYALAAKLDKLDSRKIYVLLGDGECNEGIVWEAAMAASHYNLDNVIFIIDRNAVQLDGNTEEIMSTEPLAEKWNSFGWNSIEINGNSYIEIIKAFNTATQIRGKPLVIIAYMIKGQGVEFMHNLKEFHGRAPTQKEYKQALIELEKYRENQLKSLELEVNGK